MTDQRRAVNLNWSSDLERKMAAIAAYIFSIVPKDPIFPRVLRPTHQAASKGDEYSPFEICECAAQVLAHAIRNGETVDLKGFLEQAEALKGGAILPVKGTVDSHFYDDLMVIYNVLVPLGMSNATRGESLNFKTPLMVALLHAYQYVEGKR